MDIPYSLAQLLAKVQEDRQQLPFLLHQTQQAHHKLLAEAYAEAAYDLDVNYQHIENQLLEIFNQVNEGHALEDLGKAMMETLGHIQPHTCQLINVKTELFRRVPILVRRINTEGPELLNSTLGQMRCRLPLCIVCSQLLGSLGLQRTVCPAKPSVTWTCSHCKYELNQIESAACSQCRIDGLSGVENNGRACPVCKTMQCCPVCLTMNPEAPLLEDCLKLGGELQAAVQGNGVHSKSKAAIVQVSKFSSAGIVAIAALHQCSSDMLRVGRWSVQLLQVACGQVVFVQCPQFVPSQRTLEGYDEVELRFMHSDDAQHLFSGLLVSLSCQTDGDDGILDQFVVVWLEALQRSGFEDLAAAQIAVHQHLCISNNSIVCFTALGKAAFELLVLLRSEVQQ